VNISIAKHSVATSVTATTSAPAIQTFGRADVIDGRLMVESPGRGPERTPRFRFDRRDEADRFTVFRSPFPIVTIDAPALPGSLAAWPSP
jgi:hypothetical protein